ncbi:type II secretion system secretin GspD [Desulfoluna sp.]|uniref:type II secretion system secretin GspD n=1 Tax=Desulfoluna sp. TaxID=2045199 RepID=UPI00261625C4|nr:type II secretion system secretin GspD [Desulfoluna sp.]
MRRFAACAVAGVLFAWLPVVHVDAQEPLVPAGETVSIDFNDVDIRVLIKYVSEMTGKNFIIDRKVSGKVTIISPGQISVEEAYHVFESVLDVYGFSAVPSGTLVKIVPAREAQKKSVATRLKSEAVDYSDNIVTQLVPLRYADPSELKKLFAPLISRNSSILAYKPTNTLIITDLASNINRLMKIVDSVDVTGVGQEISILPLEYADAGKLTSLLTSVFKGTSKKTKSADKATFVADERTNTIIILAGKGTTEKIIKLVKMLDREVPRGKERIHVVYLENAIAEDMAKVLQNLSSKKQAADKGKKAAIASERVNIIADKATNSLIIMAEKSDYIILEEIIKKLDIPRKMVYIECLIMEVKVEAGFAMGVEWTVGDDTTIGGRDSAFGGGFSGSDKPFAALGSAASGALPSGFSLGVFSEAIDIGGVKFPSLGALINAYNKDSNVQILSTPQVLTLDNEEASIVVGSKIPYLTKSSSGDSTYNQYEYKDVGITLKITPQVSEDRRVRLKIFQETSRVFGDLTSEPTTLQRKVDTTVVVEDKSTIVIGGLIDKSLNTTEYKVPCLGDIPVIRYLFSSLSNTEDRTNLYIFLTPRVVSSRADAENVMVDKRERIDHLREGHIKLYNEEEEKALQEKAHRSVISEDEASEDEASEDEAEAFEVEAEEPAAKDVPVPVSSVDTVITLDADHGGEGPEVEVEGAEVPADIPASMDSAGTEGDE